MTVFPTVNERRQHHHHDDHDDRYYRYDFTIKPLPEYEELARVSDVDAAVKYTDSKFRELKGIVKILLSEREKLQEDFKGLQNELQLLKFQMIMHRSRFFLPPYNTACNPFSADLLSEKPAVYINPYTKADLLKQKKLDANHQEKSSCEIF